jgi:cysteine desulfurase / selenocysteine lyase
MAIANIASPLSISIIREEFPLLNSQVNGYPLVYFDNAATTQKPEAVIQTLNTYYHRHNANIHRGAHYLANLATTQFEESRNAMAKWLNASEAAEIIFTTGTTESINLVAQCWGQQFLSAGDEIVLSTTEHHSNIVPWQMAAERSGAAIKVIPVDDNGIWDLSTIDSLITAKTKMVAIQHVSNALGSIQPIDQIIKLAKSKGAYVLIDGAQAIGHFKINVQALDCDFYAFSAHKMYGPTGVGILYGKRQLLEAMPPYRGGGEMIKSVSFAQTTYNDLPFKFEAGTPDIAGVITMHAALAFMERIGIENIAAQEENLRTAMQTALESIEGLRIFGDSQNKVPVFSFQVEGIHPSDLGTLLDKQGVAVRTGHHCTEPLWSRLQAPGSVRASLSFYNTEQEIDLFIAALRKAITMLK